MAKNLTLYVHERDMPVVQRAMKLLEFHQDKSLSVATVEMCMKIVKRYDSKVREGE